MPEKKLVEIKNLRTYFFVEPIDYNIKIGNSEEMESFIKSDKKLRGKVAAKAVDGVSFNIHEDEVLGIVGESGSGKSVTACSINRLIPDPPGRIVGGEIFFKGTDLLKLTYEEIKNYRGKEIAMIFQEPMTSLNPVMKIEDQLTEILLYHEKLTKEKALDRAVELMESVGISDAKKRIRDYPHHFSGGMRQRVVISMALACNPSLLIADEPTTALDVTIQAQIIELMMKIKSDRKNSAILLITHNLGLVAEMCSRVIVMYGGKVQEIASVKDIFDNPKHPYTVGLLESLPNPDNKQEKLKAIPGIIPHILEMPNGCKFCTRCSKATDECRNSEPELKEISEGHFVRCFYA